MSRREVLWHLTVHTEQIDGLSVVTATGRVSRATAPLLEDSLTGAAGYGSTVVLDVSGVDYLSSAGLQVLATTAARLAGRGRTLIVCEVQEAVRPAFELAGPIPHLRVEQSRSEALERAAADTDGGAAISDPPH